MMAERKYQGAGIGIERMNRIMELLLFRSATITDITLDLDICDRSARIYLGKLQDLGKITMERGSIDPRFKFYSLVPGAMPIPAVKPLTPPRRPRVEVRKKTGPKPKRLDVRNWNNGERTVKTVPAQQIGMQRDPFQALFFGQPQRQPGA